MLQLYVFIFTRTGGNRICKYSFLGLSSYQPVPVTLNPALNTTAS